jgi:tripartite-type tricarboxylate transporter receptor subunit TctC
MSAPALKETASGISRRLLLCGASGAALVAHSAAAQNTWPQKPIRLVVPFAAGGGTDIVARMIGRTLSQQLGQPVVIDNKPGASTLIGTEIAARARPDGYTLLLAASTSYSVNPALRAARAYNPSRDLAPIAIVARVPLVLFAGGTAPWHSLSELVGAAKARPGQIRYATFGNASGSHLTGELFALAAGIRLQDIPYRGSSQAMVAVIGGEVDLGIDTVASVAPHARSGKVRALGIVGAARSGLLPPSRNSTGHCTFRHRRFAVGVAVAGDEAAVEHVHLRVAREHAAHQRARAAMQPGAGAQRRGRRRHHRMREHVDHVDGLERLVLRVVQQRGRHLHREGRAHQRQVRHAFGRAAGRFQRDQRAEAVADQRRLAARRPLSSSASTKSAAFLHAGRRLAFAAAWPGRSTASTFQPWCAK